MSGFQVYVSEVIRVYRESGMSNHSGEFSVRYVYLSEGKEVVKREFRRCRRRTAGTYSKKRRDFEGIKREEKEANKLHIEFWNGQAWEERRLFIAQVTHFNGLLIDHRF
jgi:hypothetical protein